MPSLFKALGRKKPQQLLEEPAKERASGVTLLDGHFVPVSTPSSPTAADFSTNGPSSSFKSSKSGKDGGLSGLFRIRSRQQPQHSPSTTPKLQTIPQLALPEPELEEVSASLGVVFDGQPEPESLLDEKTIGEKRLTAVEASGLVQPCAQVITQRGLESLGIMHPHWHSASLSIQNKLISIYIKSLSAKYKGPSFASEAAIVPMQHDIAAVLRWAIRHLALPSPSFASATSSTKANEDPWEWYYAYAKAEKADNYPPKAFSTILAPALPKENQELLISTLDIMASLAAHAEQNSISGSKLSKMFGFWLLLGGERTSLDDGWASFYQKWEKAGKILEHVFLARVREEALNHRLPTRLLELVAQYPYSKSASQGSDARDAILFKPLFATRSIPALYVRYTTTLPPSRSASMPTRDVSGLLIDCLTVEHQGNGPYAEQWDKIKLLSRPSSSPISTETKTMGGPNLSQILNDESVQLFKRYAEAQKSAIVVESERKPAPAKSESTEARNSPRRGSISSPPVSTTSESMDWAQFQSAGFSETAKVAPLAATLEGSPSLSSANFGRLSTVNRKAVGKLSGNTYAPAKPEEPLVSRTTDVDLIQLDEAFTDFFADAVLDRISYTWPRFVLAKLLPLPGIETTGGHQPVPIQWLVVEQVFVAPPPSAAATTESPRAASPKPPSMGKKRFSIFSASSSSSIAEKDKGNKTKSPKMPVVGEMGDVLTPEKLEPAKKMPAPVVSADTELAPKKATQPTTSVAKSPEILASPPKPKHNGSANIAAGGAFTTMGTMAANVSTPVTVTPPAVHEESSSPLAAGGAFATMGAIAASVSSPGANTAPALHARESQPATAAPVERMPTPKDNVLETGSTPSRHTGLHEPVVTSDTVALKTYDGENVPGPKTASDVSAPQAVLISQKAPQPTDEPAPAVNEVEAPTATKASEPTTAVDETSVSPPVSSSVEQNLIHADVDATEKQNDAPATDSNAPSNGYGAISHEVAEPNMVESISEKALNGHSQIPHIDDPVK